MSRDSNASRYGRITRLVDVTALSPKRVLAMCAGSMGQPVLNQLARHGVGCKPPGGIHVVDGDVVEDRNLIGTDYRIEHIGQPKVDAAASITREVSPDANVSSWNHRVTKQDIPEITNMARQSNLVGLFADTFDVMIDVADRCLGICPVVMAVFGPNADFAEVAFSIPGATPSLRRSMGNRPRQQISSPSAFGCDTLFVASFAAAVCLELLLAPADRGKLVPCYAEAPLFAVGLRRSWIFKNQPADIARTITHVQVPF